MCRICPGGARAGATAAALMLFSAVRAALADPQFTILDLGTFGGTTSQAGDINNAGQIAGFATDASGAKRAFRTAAAYSAINPATDNLGILAGGTYSQAHAINDSGTVSGEADNAIDTHAFRFSNNGPMQNIGTLGGDWSYGDGINASGQIVGGSAIVPGPFSQTNAFLYSGNQMHDLGTLGGANMNAAYYSAAYAINKDGLVVGYSRFDPVTPWLEHAFLWTPTSPNATTGSMSDLGTLGGSYSYAWSINDKSQIVGGSFLSGDTLYHAYRHWNGGKIDLGTLGGADSEGFDINLSGAIVGDSVTAAGETRAFLFTNGRMYDLNALIPAGSGWSLLQRATAINDSGSIVGYGTTSGGDVHGFLLKATFVDPVWNVDAGGTWSTAGNWLNGVPDAASVGTNFASAISVPRTITVDAPQTVGRISFDNVKSYTLAGAGPLTIDVSAAGDSGTISVLSGSHTIATPLILSDDVNINVLPSDQTLTISGAVGSPGSASLIKGGAGMLVLSGNNTYSGFTAVTSGVLCAGTSANLGDANNGIALAGGTLRTTGAIVSPGRSVELLQDGGSVDTNGFDSTFGAVSGTAGLVKQSAGTLTVKSFRLATLAIAGGAVRVADDGSAGGTSTAAQLDIAAATRLDLRDNKLVVHAQPAGSWNGSAYTDVTALVQSGRNGGGWDGSGIVTSAATGNVTTLGVATAQEVKSLATASDTAIWAGQTVTGSDALVMYTYGGDANLDGKINVDDYGRIDFNVNLGTSGWFNGDFNYDGKINVDDYGIIDFNVGIQGAPFFTAGGPTSVGLSAVPEPASGLLLLCGFASLALHRRQRAADVPRIDVPRIDVPREHFPNE